MVSTNPKKHIAVLADYLEENWPSMRLVAEQLHAGVNRLDLGFHSDLIRPTFQRFATRLGPLGSHPTAFNLDRLINRFISYPDYLRTLVGRYDYFHVSDHSYGRLVSFLPAERTGIFCHDTDAFQSVCNPKQGRSFWYREMSRKILEGFQKAALVFYSTESVRDSLISNRLVDPKKLVKSNYGFDRIFSPESHGETSLPVGVRLPYLLHVGSLIARKRGDVLLQSFAFASKEQSDLQLVQVGGEWNSEHLKLIANLGISDRILQLRGVSESILAELYRKSSALLLTSDQEGFGLPILEALASGTPVIASDISALREVGGNAIVYCKPGQPEEFAKAIRTALLATKRDDVQLRLSQAAKFSWDEHARIILNAYQKL